MNKLFFIFCTIVFLFKTETVFSNNLIYNVNNIEVSSKINNNLDKKKLIQAAFQKAFTIFVNKTLLKNDAASLYSTKISTIENLVFSYQIIKEETKNKKENILTFNIKFDQKKIINFLAQNRISYADVVNISLTLLPVLIKDKEVFMFADNFFYTNWLKSSDKLENINDMLISYNLALENIEDLQYINMNKENLDLIDVKKIVSFNNVENYTLILIYSIEDKFRAYIKTSIANKEIDKSVNLKIYFGNETRTYEEAIITLKEEINQIWKGQNLIDINTPSFLDLFLDTKKINDYLKLRSIFNSLDLIDDYYVQEMTKDYTKVRVKYKGKLNKLRDKLLEKKINIKIVDNVWRITVN
jgi:hypothetical protein|tara:strand:- start:1055 stop:2122 length:1068 start_codon:yes stop_codon:yes gene_type:complete